MFYVVRPVTDEGRGALDAWRAAATELDWSFVRDGEDVSLSLHGCDFVRDWERESGWKLPKKARSSLHDDMVTLFAHVPGDLELTATWSDDSIDRAHDLSRTEALSRILANQIANRTTYRIAAADDGRLA